MTQPGEITERVVDEVGALLARLYRKLVADGVPEAEATLIAIAWMIEQRRNRTSGSA